MKKVALLALSVVLVGCGETNSPSPGGNLIVGIPDQEGLVVRSRSEFTISTDDAGAQSGNLMNAFQLNSRNALTGGTTITVTNSSSAAMTISTSLFSIPTIASEMLDFGFLQVSALLDNDLKQCGNNSNQKCGTAIIRMYTTGVAGEGLYNATDGYGAPITAGQSTLSTVGLDGAGAAVMQSISIPNNKHVLRLSDFTNPKYNVKSDFSNAGAGSYSTTLVIEYALAP